MDSAATLALAVQAQERHGCSLSITCRLCIPPTRWPCGAWRRAQQTIERLAATTHPPVHPGWLDGHST